MGNIKEMALPLMGLIGVCLFLFIGYLLWTSESNKRAVKGKIWAEILLESKQIWSGLCDYSDGKVRAPWNKSDDKVGKDDKIQVFLLDGEHTFHTMWPPGKGWFQAPVSKAYFHEKKVGAQLPRTACKCGNLECEHSTGMELTPTQLGQMEREHVTEAAIKATAFAKEVFDKLGELVHKIPPAWITIVGFVVVGLAIIMVGVLVWTMKGDVSSLLSLHSPAPAAPTP